MKHFSTLAFAVVLMLAALPGVASASKPVDGAFTIKGYATDYTFETLPNGLTSFHLSAAGGVTGYFEGPFTYEEWGTVDFDPLTGQGSMEGKNYGVLTINASDGDVVAEFRGKTGMEGVTGGFALQQKNGTRTYNGLDGVGTYVGSGGMEFEVTFTGQFH